MSVLPVASGECLSARNIRVTPNALLLRCLLKWGATVTLGYLQHWALTGARCGTCRNDSSGIGNQHDGVGGEVVAAGGQFVATDIWGYCTSQGAAARVCGPRWDVHITPAINSLYSFGRVLFLFRIVRQGCTTRCVGMLYLQLFAIDRRVPNGYAQDFH